MTGRSIDLTTGVELHVLEWEGDDASPFLLVHGMASNAHLWDGVAARLAARGRAVAAVDLRGHGRSDKPPADSAYDVATVAADVAALLDVLGWTGQATVVGQSWGGNVVLELAATTRAAVAIACIDGGWIDLRSRFETWEACAARLAPPPLVGTPLAQIEGWFRRAHPDWPDEGIAGQLANFEVRADGTIDPWLTLERHLAVLRGLWDHRPADRYAHVAVPVLLIPCDTGDAGHTAAKRVEVAAAEAGLAASITRWWVADHDVHAQHPEPVAALLVEVAAAGASR